MDCPRCKLPLLRETYEGYEVDICHACWGFWLDHGELEKILISRRSPLSEDEKEKALKERKAPKNPMTPVACPKCARRMERLYIDPALYLVIDRCPDHGVWLDTGEIKTMQAKAESSRELCRSLVDRIGRKTPGGR
jgi:Zn-finger nucleic acid-binding protein